LCIVAILNPRVEDMLYISAWEFFGYFAGGGWVCIFFPSRTFACHEWGPIPGYVMLRNRGVV